MDGSMLMDTLSARGIPPLLTGKGVRQVNSADDWRARRLEILDLMRREIYGYAPCAPERVTGEVVRREQDAFAGKATRETISISFETAGGAFSFPIELCIPKRTGETVPAFVILSFRAEIPNVYLPAEEMLDAGFAFANLHYSSVTADDASASGLASMVPVDPRTGFGKIGMWAFAASRALDYLRTRGELDPARIAVAGHSRLGKTALWCAAQDERFSMAISNDSGCAGAALFRGKVGERIENITRVFPYWFCGEFRKYAGREAELPFDQHMLLALLAPRPVYVASAERDEWADPASEFLACVAASDAYRLLGREGLADADLARLDGALPRPLYRAHAGEIGYHLRAGTHYHSRTDWLEQMAYRRAHGV